MRRAALSRAIGVVLLAGNVWLLDGEPSSTYAADNDLFQVTGTVQHQDLRRVDQAIVHVRDQEGNLVAQSVTNPAGEFRLLVPESGTYSISAVQDTYRSEYVVIKIGAVPPPPVSLTLAITREIALEIVSPPRARPIS